ncbi:hypothetical protein DENSPDRAFT_519287 [Dentipellis sp. KUC8613]|nr:hypothetical protein DENSPDRAFT_519287 [Dentipellis sp. KUC8613]
MQRCFLVREHGHSGIRSNYTCNPEKQGCAVVLRLSVSRVLSLWAYADAANDTVYDHLCTLADEVEFVWGGSWSPLTVVFLLNRYVAFPNICIAIYYQLGSDLSAPTCSGLHGAIARLISGGVYLSEIILCLRTYALWGKSKRVGCALVGMAIVVGAIACPFLIKGNPSVQFAPTTSLPVISTESPLRGCFATGSGDPPYIISWSLILAFETAIAGLTLAKALQNSRRTVSPLLFILYRDGIAAYLILLVLSISNVLVAVLAPHEYTKLLLLIQHAFHVILTSHIVLNIRREAVNGAIVDVSGKEIGRSVLELFTFSRKEDSG